MKGGRQTADSKADDDFQEKQPRQGMGEQPFGRLLHPVGVESSIVRGPKSGGRELSAVDVRGTAGAKGSGQELWL